MELGLGLGGEDIVVRHAESWIQFQKMTSATKADLVQNTRLVLRLGLELGSQRQNYAHRFCFFLYGLYRKQKGLLHSMFLALLILISRLELLLFLLLLNQNESD